MANAGKLFVDTDYNDGKKRWVCQIMAVMDHQKMATAERIVACVNALDHIPDPAGFMQRVREAAVAVQTASDARDDAGDAFDSTGDLYNLLGCLFAEACGEYPEASSTKGVTT